MQIDTSLTELLKRDRTVVLAALIAVIVLSWGYILAGAGMPMSAFEMTRLFRGDAPMMMQQAPWDLGYAALMFAMWWIMMIAMMLPSAAPMILLFAAMNRKQREAAMPHVPTLVFAGAYLFAWAGFSAVAVAVQWGLQGSGLLNPMLESSSAFLNAGLLIAAGVYQLAPLKQACLKHCRSPLQFLMSRWRSGTSGAFGMGLEHGLYCVGCCWFLMGLLFFGGIMNIYWIAGLALLVLVEKTLPDATLPTYTFGLGLILWGGILFLTSL